jgi:tRNA(Ile)-lysidine synthase
VTDRDIQDLREAVGAALEGSDRLVLAISGGIDSMTLLDVASDLVDPARLTVATFDHGTGAAATSAVAFVQEQAARRGIDCVAERARTSLAGEAALRHARWEFLRRLARERNATICTGHTEDDQIETVLMRLMRDASARGLAALYARSDVMRPLLGVRRGMVERYARARGLHWVEDPSNDSAVYHRNRLRGDLLPALRRADPSIDVTLLATARSAAQWRHDVERLCDTLADVRVFDAGRGLSVPVGAFSSPFDKSARILWPELASRVGAVLDRRGIARLAQFTLNSRVGARVQLSGGWEVVRARNSFGLRQVSASEATSEPSALSDGTRFGNWTFRAGASSTLTSNRDSWSAWLPTHAPLLIRPWQAGDAMVVGPDGSRRKVKGLLSAAGVTGHEKAGWPVVLSGSEIVWVPGVRRTTAAAARSGRPGLAFVCEYDNR